MEVEHLQQAMVRLLAVVCGCSMAACLACVQRSSPVGVPGCYMGTSRECACVRVCVGKHTMCVGLLYAAGMCAGVE